MNPMNYKEEQDIRVHYIEAVINGYLPKEEGYQKTIFEAMNYSILAGGKRLRPMLMLETYRLFGGTDTDCIEPFMAAIEMIHTYSLVHDDLPALDNDEYRRNRKTTHIVYGEAMGILAGDALLNFAFETACKSFSHITNENNEDISNIHPNINRPVQTDSLVLSARRLAKSIGVLSQKSGVFGMIGGQVIDVEGFEYTSPNSSEENIEQQDLINRLNHMYMLKTGALIEASMMIGAILAGANEQEINTVEQMAADIGLAFQIQDDILDETSTMEVLGKPIHSDERNEKVTYVTLIGIEKAKQEVSLLSNNGLAGFQILGRKNEFLQELIKKLITREK